MTNSHFKSVESIKNIKAATMALFLGMVFMSAQAQSDGKQPIAPPQYKQECTACHIAYPPGMLPAASWQRMMGGLDKHFGVDASLDTASVTKIGDWLRVNAGTYKGVGTSTPSQDRITTSSWFVRKHSEDISAAVWKRPSIGSASNCAACHTRASEGNFSEREIKIPK
jgi:mono/diheme cytochrome c family protein